MTLLHLLRAGSYIGTAPATVTATATTTAILNPAWRGIYHLTIYIDMSSLGPLPLRVLIGSGIVTLSDLLIRSLAVFCT